MYHNRNLQGLFGLSDGVDCSNIGNYWNNLFSADPQTEFDARIALTTYSREFIYGQPQNTNCYNIPAVGTIIPLCGGAYAIQITKVPPVYKIASGDNYIDLQWIIYKVGSVGAVKVTGKAPLDANLCFLGNNYSATPIFSFDKQYQTPGSSTITPTAQTDPGGNVMPTGSTSTPVNNPDCPCDCREVIKKRVLYLTKQQTGNSVPVSLQRKRVVCDLTNKPGSQYSWDCNQLEALKQKLNSR